MSIPIKYYMHRHIYILQPFLFSLMVVVSCLLVLVFPVVLLALVPWKLWLIRGKQEVIQSMLQLQMEYWASFCK